MLERIKRIFGFFKFDTYGNIALAAFLVCTVSGIVLAIPYDVQAAFDSLSLMLIANPAALFFRNMHYWSAQLFVVFTLLHTWEHFRLRSAQQLSNGIWFRLTVSLFIVFFVMLTGFILKADADSLQARRIFESLLQSIPLAGSLLVDLVLGQGKSLQLIYIHHAATATIILFIIIFEHSRLIWTRKMTFFISLAIISILAFFIQAPLSELSSPVLKGPWYFVGLQEVLHYTSHPGWIWIVPVILFLLFLILKFARGHVYRSITTGLVITAVLYLVLTLIGFYFRGENWKWQVPWDSKYESQFFPFDVGFLKLNEKSQSLTAQDIPIVQGKREACMICHTNVSGFSLSHDPKAIGCTSCHLGQAFTLNKTLAHQNMIHIPGNLNDAAQSCGTTQCHPDIPGRVNLSLMTTNSGIVSVDRFVFGESSSPDSMTRMSDIHHGPADTHLRNLCSKCHLGNEKTETGSITELSRGGGCLACHLNYSDEGRTQHDAYLTSGKQESHLPAIHPSVDLHITNNHCFGCHSRSGRIATNYEGWHETLLDTSDVSGLDNYRVLEDHRVFEKVPDDIHHAAGMDCIDCHDSYEVMGDGKKYAHEEQAVLIRCEDCHFKGEGLVARFNDLDVEESKIFKTRKYKHQDEAMVKKLKSGKVMINTLIDKEGHFLISKNSDSLHSMKPPAVICTGNQGHKNLSCSACHTAWAPQCIGCHNAFDKDAPGYDLLEKKEVAGSWVEYVGKFFAEAPTLGVSEGDSDAIIPALPGMVLSIDTGSFSIGNLPDQGKSALFRRLFAPAAPHTISAKGRSCKSCHNNPLAIGYGRGKLRYQIKGKKGKWSFTPEFSGNKYDGLPEDAWIGFLSEPATEVPLSTRTDFRPFSLKEQERILRIGACLTCHDENSEMMKKCLMLPEPTLLDQISASCILPDFNK